MKVKLLRVGPIGTNCYILEDDQTNLAAVIDPGDEPELIQEALEKEGVEVRYLLLTHGHYDHTTAVPALHRVYPQADIYIHQADANGAGSTLFPLAGEVDDLKLYDEGDVIRLGGPRDPGAPHPRPFPRLRHPEGGGRAFHWGHPVRRLLRPHRPAGGQL